MRNYFLVCCLALIVPVTIALGKTPRDNPTIGNKHDSNEHVVETALSADIGMNEWVNPHASNMPSEAQGWIHVVSNILIWGVFFAILTILVGQLRRMQDDSKAKSMLFIIVLFIFTASLVFFADVIVFWQPNYELTSAVRLIAAIASFSALFALVKSDISLLPFRSQDEYDALKSENDLLHTELLATQNNHSNLNAAHLELKFELQNQADAIDNLRAQLGILQSTNELFQAAQGAAKIGVWEIMLDDDSFYCSSEVYNILKLKNNHHIQKHDILTYIHPDHQNLIKNGLDNYIDKGIHFDIEIKLSIDQDEIHWVRIVGLPLYDGKDLKAMRGLVMDINQSKLAEQTAADGTKVLSMALEAGEIGTWKYDIKSNQIEWDAYTHQIMGMTSSDMKSSMDSFIGHIHEDDVSVVQNRLSEAMRLGIKFEAIYRVIRPDGKESILQAKGEIVRDTSNNAMAIIGICINITEQKNYEQTLRESEQRFKAAVDYSPAGVALLNITKDLLQVNASMSNMLGYDQNDLLKLGFTKITHEEDRGLDRAAFKSMLEGSLDTFQLDKRYVKSDGSLLWVQQNVSVVRNENHTPKYFIVQLLDITERVVSEQHIQDLVRQRTAQLEATNQELEAFSYSVSHDLRAPLRSIHGFSQALIEDYSEVLDQTGLEYLSRVSAAGVRMGNLIDDLLGLSRINKRELNPEKVNLSKLALQIAETLRRDQYENIEFEIQPELSAYGDAGLISVVLKNLFENAAKYSRKKAMPRFQFGQEVLQGEKVFYVADNGVGFDMKYEDKLFGVFQRLHAAHEFEGTGIGLATVKRIILRHGGNIWAESTLGEGAKFYFTLK